MRFILIAAAIVLGTAGNPAVASEAFSRANALDQVEAGYTRHTYEHRMWEIRRTQEMRGRRGYRGEGYGYRRGGPPPWAPAYGRRYRDRGYDRY